MSTINGRGMSLTEIGAKYGPAAVEWIEGKIRDGTFRPPVALVSLKNPKFRRTWLRSTDRVVSIGPDGYPYYDPPTECRPYDRVMVEIPDE